MAKGSEEKNINYNFKKQKMPSKPMGQDDFANLPNRPIYMTFTGKNDYRGGIVNNFTTNVSEVSGIEENGY